MDYRAIQFRDSLFVYSRNSDKSDWILVSKIGNDSPTEEELKALMRTPQAFSITLLLGAMSSVNLIEK